METRRETKRQVIALRTMLRSQGLTAQQRADMEANIVQLRGKLDSVESQINPTEIAARREFLHKNKGLLDIFNTFWVILLVYTTDGFLSKEGYSKFHHAVEIALAGEATFASVDEQALNADWTYDRMLYGNLNKIAFFDMLFELIETWTEIVDPTYYAAFAWALLDSIADTAIHPPKLRPLREMRCITKMDNEASMIKAYVKKRKVRAALSIESEALQRIPEVQKRLHARKHGHNFNDAQLTMVEALSLQAGRELELQFLESDGESVHTATSLQAELSLQQNWRDEARANDSHSDSDSGSDFDDELNDTNTNTGDLNLQSQEEATEFGDNLGALAGSGSPKSLHSRKFSKANSQHVHTKPTASFLAYCQQRRATRVQLNGLYGMSNVASHEGSATASLSTGSGIIDMNNIVTLPSVMSSLYSDSRSESDRSLRTEDMHSSRSQNSLNSLHSGAYSLGSNSNNQQHSRSQSTLQVHNVMHIDSPTRRPSNNNSNNNSGHNINPYGGNVGDKARFSQFMASGKRLGSFARGYLHTHEVTSGVSLDPFTGGSKAVTNTINSQRSVAEAMKMTKNPTPLGQQPSANASHSHSVGHLSTLVEESFFASQAQNQGQGQSLGLGTLTMLGKSMYVPPALSHAHSVGAHASNRNSDLTKHGSKHSLHSGLTQKGLNARSSANMGIAQIATDFPSALHDQGPPTLESDAFTDTYTDGGDTNNNSALSSPGGSPKASTFSPPPKNPAFTASVSGNVTNKDKKQKSGISDEPYEFGDVVDDGTSKYFNVLDTQLQELSVGDSFFRPELTSELLMQNSSHKENASAATKGKQNKKKREPKTGTAANTGFNYKDPRDVRGVDVKAPALKGPEPGNRGCFMLVESQAPPLEKVKTVYRAQSRGATTPPQSASRTPSQANLSQFSDSASERFGFTRNSSEILSVDVPVSSVISLLSPAPQNASFEALLGIPEQKPQARVSAINFPFGPSKSLDSLPKGTLARTNSNVSYADSEVSFDSSHQLVESAPNAFAADQLVNVKSGAQTMFPARAASMQAAFSATTGQIPSKQGRSNKKMSPLLVLDPSVSSASSRQQSRSTHSRSEAERTIDMSATLGKPKRGTNLAIVQPHHVPMKPEYATFPQGMYYNVVKHALDLRQQPGFNPSWDHTRASKGVRLSAIKRPVDVSLSLTTAAMNVSNANKLAEVIKNTEYHQKILGGVLQNAPKKPPLMINITSSKSEQPNQALKLGSMLDSSSLATTSAESGRQSPHRPAQLQRGSFAIPSAGEVQGNMLAKNAIPVPDALLESFVMLRDNQQTMSDDVFDTETGSVGGSLGGGASTALSQSSSPGKNGIIPSLLIKPVGSAVNLQPPVITKTSGLDNSPPKSAYFDHQGKLQVKDVDFKKKDLFEIHSKIDTMVSTGKSTAMQFTDSQLAPSQVSTLVPIKHPYLTVNGTKHVLPDRVMASIVNARKNASQYDAEESMTESVFLGNSSGLLIRDSTLGHTTESPAQGIPWLPRGTLEPLEHDRSNTVLGKREHLDLQRYSSGEPSRQVLTIRSQKAIREAFEDYVTRHLQGQYQNKQHAPEFHQLNRTQQDTLLQQYQAQQAKLLQQQAAKSPKSQKSLASMSVISE